MFKNYRNTILLCGILLLAGAAFFLFKTFNPENSALFPQCPSKYITGYDCPGCGTQRAIHSLLNGNFNKAFNYNPLLFFLLPYAIIVGCFEWIPGLMNHSLRRVFMNRYLILGLFVFIIAFTFWRNL